MFARWCGGWAARFRLKSELGQGSTFTVMLPTQWNVPCGRKVSMNSPVTIVMIEDDEGHARLIESNIRRAGVNNEIMPFTNGTDAVNYLFGADGSGTATRARRC